MIALIALLASAAPGGALPQQPDAADLEEFLGKARVVNSRPAGKGVTDSQRLTLSDGRLTHDAHISHVEVASQEFQGNRGTELNFRDSYKYNIAAYRLSSLLGLDNVPVSVFRRIGGRSGAVSWWVDHVQMDEGQRQRKKIDPPEADAWNCQMHVVRVFDQLIANTDRNLGNLLIDKHWKIWMIDHTRAFRLVRGIPQPRNLVRCERGLLERLRALDEATLARELKPYLNNLEIRGLLARRDAIVKFFDDQAAAKGEGNVLYTFPR